jgi:hypothetical protein
MTQKEVEKILLKAGWVVYREMAAYRTWIYPGTRTITDVWNESLWADTSWGCDANKANFAQISPDMLLPKEIADVLKHCC